jgi:lysophospholipase L1-like esterase
LFLSRTPTRFRPSVAFAGILTAAVFAAAGGFGATASSDQPNHLYLALGDSVAFGFIAGDGFAYSRPNNFMGYPDFVGRDLRLETVNASCPGEASGGFMIAAPGGNDNGCRPFKALFPLHASYGGAATQMDFAVGFLKANPNTRLVTLGIGANDAFILQRVCGADQSCLVAGLAAMSANVDAILGGLRATGYRGVLEVVNYYSLDYGDPAQVQGAQLLNHFETASAAAHGAVIADVYTAMQTAASGAGGHTCEAGLLNITAGAPAPAFPNCDVHPSIAGQQTLAQAVETAFLAATQD